jgi:hypothetical protein
VRGPRHRFFSLTAKRPPPMPGLDPDVCRISGPPAGTSRVSLIPTAGFHRREKSAATPLRTIWPTTEGDRISRRGN